MSRFTTKQRRAARRRRWATGGFVSPPTAPVLVGESCGCLAGWTFTHTPVPAGPTTTIWVTVPGAAYAKPMLSVPSVWVPEVNR